MSVIRVVVADDDPAFRGALHDVLQADARFEVVGIAATGHELAELVRDLQPEVVLLDVRMPGGGEVAARALTGPDAVGEVPTVVVVSAQSGAAGILSMLRAGAVGFLGKGRLGAQLPDLLARIMEGEVVLAVPGAAEALRQLVRDGDAAVTTDAR
ncbi:response regulator transcription factor [Nocardioides sp. KIGAM211]|uniref:Response regulator transcription factor n=1 Tax=Nocardioides luti TaxID=2761101 RepID=A0A7X0VC13_9ACTN|nr:response regulator [Nocardioides luti]MBB6627763.1 response regulator transcription factor [Nocardioides luti]